MPRVLVLLIAASLLLENACGVSCTLLPCPGLTVQLDGAIPTTYTVSLAASGVQRQSRTCSPTSLCPENTLHFTGYSADLVTVTVAWEGGAVAITVRPAYETVYPNGPHCGRCRAATITVAIGDIAARAV